MSSGTRSIDTVVPRCLAEASVCGEEGEEDVGGSYASVHDASDAPVLRSVAYKSYMYWMP